MHDVDWGKSQFKYEEDCEESRYIVVWTIFLHVLTLLVLFFITLVILEREIMLAIDLFARAYFEFKERNDAPIGMAVSNLSWSDPVKYSAKKYDEYQIVPNIYAKCHALLLEPHSPGPTLLRLQILDDAFFLLKLTPNLFSHA